MAFWNSDTLRKRLPGLITGYDQKNVQNGFTELGLGSDAHITGQKKKIQLGEKGHVVIPAGQFALLITEESVRIPPEAIGSISIKLQFKMWGLINVSGFMWILDLMVEVDFLSHNAGVQNIIISRKTRVFQLWLSSWDQPGDVYQGKRLGQKTIPDEDMMKIRGEIPSIVALQRQIDRLQNKVTTYTAIAGVLIGLMVAILGKVIFYDPDADEKEGNRLEERYSATSLPSPNLS